IKTRNTGRFICHEADQLLPNVRKNKRASRNSGTRTSARPSAGRINRKARLWWTKRKNCVRCVSTRRNRRRCSALAAATTTKRILSNYSHRTASQPITNRQASGGTGVSPVSGSAAGRGRPALHQPELSKKLNENLTRQRSQRP